MRDKISLYKKGDELVDPPLFTAIKPLIKNKIRSLKVLKNRFLSAQEKAFSLYLRINKLLMWDYTPLSSHPYPAKNLHFLKATNITPAHSIIHQ